MSEGRRSPVSSRAAGGPTTDAIDVENEIARVRYCADSASRCPAGSLARDAYVDQAISVLDETVESCRQELHRIAHEAVAS